MTRNALLKKLDTVMAEAERCDMYGSIEIEVRAGEGVLLRKISTERLGMEKHSDEQFKR